MENDKKIILFDGVCNLCNGAVQFIIKRDQKDVFRYASLQSDIGKELTAERNIDTSKLDSMILIEPGVAFYTKSDAVLEIGRSLRNYSLISNLCLSIPKGLRNIVYDFMAKNRYSWFGKKTECMIPTPEMRAKFL